MSFVVNSWSHTLPLLAAQALDDDNSPSDIWNGWGSVMLAIVVVMLVGLLLALVIWQVFKTAQSRINTDTVVAREEAYRKLVEQTTAAQEQLVTEQSRIASDLAEMRSRVVAIEQMLREVG